MQEIIQARSKYAKYFEDGDKRLYIVRAKPWHYQDAEGRWIEVNPQWQKDQNGWSWRLEGCGYRAWIKGNLCAIPFLRVVDENGKESLYRLGNPEWRTPAGAQTIGQLPALLLSQGRKKYQLEAPAFLHPQASLYIIADNHRISIHVELSNEARDSLPPCTLERYGTEPQLVVPLVPLGVSVQETYYGSTADGYIYGYSTIYANARSTSTACTSDAATARLGQRYDGSGHTVFRAYVSFDTSTIPSDAEIISAKLYVKAALDMSVTDFDIRVYRWAWSEPLCSSREANYDGAYGTGAVLEGVLCNTVNGWNPGTYYGMAVDTSGINKSGNTKYTLVSARDVNANAPTGYEYVDFYTAEEAGTSSDPYLEIETAAGFTLLF